MGGVNLGIVDRIMLYGKIYSAAQATAYNEIISRIATCPSCGADVDQWCFSANRGLTQSKSPHADRRTAAEQWRKANREEYEQLKQELIRYYVELSIKDLNDV